MELEIDAQYVEAQEEEFTPDYSVVGIYFGEGDPENGGQHWNFTQSIGDEEDEGVCTVKEIQQLVLYGNIDKFSLSKSQLHCTFNDSVIEKTGFKTLIINYQVSGQQWLLLQNMAKKVFNNEPYFNIT
jgi:hypothetical protein